MMIYIFLNEISSKQMIKSENAIDRSVTKPVTVNPNVHQSSHLLSIWTMKISAAARDL